MRPFAKYTKATQVFLRLKNQINVFQLTLIGIDYLFGNLIAFRLKIREKNSFFVLDVLLSVEDIVPRLEFIRRINPTLMRLSKLHWAIPSTAGPG
jgi:hypothetical protein